MFSVLLSPTYNLRSNDNTLMLLKPKTNVMKRSVSYFVGETWNGLPLTDRLKTKDNR